ncbi:MAG: hypothetical protein KC435_02890 [Thermomicrobiales bacterium]|nr:hypothetical protein [Thermomicrobiales bacterium]
MSIKRSLAGVALAFSIAIGGTSALAQNDDFWQKMEDAAQESRELDLLETLDITTITRAEYAEQNAASMEEDFPAEDTADWQQVLVFMGYLDEDQDIAQIYTDLYSGQVLGYYDPTTKELVIISENEGDWSVVDQSTIVHEMTHAIQDQHYDLLAIQSEDDVYTDDSYLAVTSMIEGDAVTSETIWLVRNDLIDAYNDEVAEYDNSALDTTPFFLQEATYFPYIQGADFIISFWQDGGWEAVNKVWENPPTTTEQILHPEKYLAGEEAIPVAIADPTESMDGWRVLEYNQNGEFGMGLFLRNGGASDVDAGTASEGWGGDADYIVTNDEDTAMVWVSTWDTEGDADEYLEQLVAVESNRLGGEFEEVDANTLRLEGDGWFAEIHHDGADVVYFLSTSADGLEQVIASQDGATVQDAATPQRSPEDAATPVNSVAFWVRESE